MKFAYNSCCDSYYLNSEGIQRYNEICRELKLSRTISENVDFSDYALDPIYIQVVEELGDKAGICMPEIIEVDDAVVAPVIDQIRTTEYPSHELYKFLYYPDEDGSDSNSSSSDSSSSDSDSNSSSSDSSSSDSNSSSSDSSSSEEEIEPVVDTTPKPQIISVEESMEVYQPRKRYIRRT